MQLFSMYARIFLCFITSAAMTAECRIVSLSPALTELVCYLGAADQLAGRTSACDYPESIRHLPSTGQFGIPEIERIAALRPNWVIGNDLMNNNVIRKLRELNIEIEIRQITTLDDYRYWVKLIGHKTNRREAAQSELKRINRQLEQLAALPESGISVLWVVNAQPLMVAGPGSLPDMVMKLMKVKNSAASVPAKYFKCSNEWLLRNNPDWLVWAVPGSPNGRDNRSVWSKVPAVQRRRIIENIYCDPVMRPGPRFLESVLKLRAEITR